MSIEREQLVEAVWIADVNKKYLGVRKMKAIAQEITKVVSNAERNTKKWFFVEYKKYRRSEWLQWSDFQLLLRSSKHKDMDIKQKIGDPEEIISNLNGT